MIKKIASLILMMACNIAIADVRVANVVGKMPYVEGQISMEHQFDGLGKTEGWRVDKYYIDDLGHLARSIKNYDIVIFGREHNEYVKGNIKAIYDAILDFVHCGGILIVDYAGATSAHNWIFELLNEKLPARIDESKSPFIAGASPLLSFPNVIMGADKKQCEKKLPISYHGLEILKAGNGLIELAVKKSGKGVIIMNRCASSSAMIMNVWISRKMFSDSDLVVSGLRTSKFLPGTNHIEFTLHAGAALTLDYTLDLFLHDKVINSENGKLQIKKGDNKIKITFKGPNDGFDSFRMKWSIAGKSIFGHDWPFISPPLMTTCLSTDFAASGQKIDALAVLHSNRRINGTFYEYTVTGSDINLQKRIPIDERLYLSGDVFEIPVISSAIKKGKYAYSARLIDASGTVMARYDEAFEICDTVEFPEVCLRADGVMLRDGQPYFPIGFYRVTTDSLKFLADSSVNLVAEVNSFPHRDGFRPFVGSDEIPAVKNAGLQQLLMTNWYVTGKLRNDPAQSLGQLWRKELPRLQLEKNIIAWYLMDEPSPAVMNEASWAYRLIRQIAPKRPVILTLHLLQQEYDKYSKVGPFCDILNVDPYPWPYRSVDEIALHVDDATRLMRGRGGVWATLQTFRYSTDEKSGSISKFPTKEWLRCTAYLALTHGAKGIMCFSLNFLQDGSIPQRHPNIWAEYTEVLEELRELEKFWLAEKSYVGRQDATTGIHWYSAVADGKSAVIAVNGTNTKKKIRIQFMPETQCHFEVFNEKRTVTTDMTGGFTEEFLPYERHVYICDSNRLLIPVWRCCDE